MVRVTHRLIEIVKGLKGSYYPDGHSPITFVERRDNSEMVEYRLSSMSKTKETQNILIEKEKNMTNTTDNTEETHKIVLNKCFGGFGLSEEAIAYLEKQPEVIELRKKEKIDNLEWYFEDDRMNPALIRCVEELGEKSFGPSAELCIVTFKGNKYLIREYDGCEEVETPDGMLWATVESNEKPSDKPDQSNIDEEKAEKIDLAKISLIEDSVKQGKNRTDAFQELYAFTQKNTTPTVLVVAIMNAQEMSFYPKGENEEAVSPILIPYALKVVRGALNNPSCNQDVTEISSHTLDVFANNNFTEEWKPKIQAQLEEAYGDLNRSNNSNTRQNRQDFDVNTARIECATKYMGARGMDFVRDANGNHLLVPRNNGTGDLQSRINAELERQNNSVSEKQKPQLQIHTPKKSQVRKY